MVVNSFLSFHYEMVILSIRYPNLLKHKVLRAENTHTSSTKTLSNMYVNKTKRWEGKKKKQNIYMTEILF